MEQKIEMIAHEAFMRRASELEMPFMLKGSYVSRQYFANPSDRIPMDLDWVYLEKLDDVEITRQIFDEWVIKVTEIQKDDGVKFRSFTENQFWRMIDYAMSDDFPTVNTDILCWIDGEICEFSMDLSFNLDVPIAPVSLDYKPLRGESFTIPYTVPLPLQISWKFHQTIVRPRLKDIFDLIHLLRHPSFTTESLEQTLDALTMECNAENIGKERIKTVFSGDLSKIYEGSNIEREWAWWRHENYSYSGVKFGFGYARQITDSDKSPQTVMEFEEEFRVALQNAGITTETVERMAIKNYSKPPIEESTETEIENTSWLDSLKKFFG